MPNKSTPYRQDVGEYTNVIEHQNSTVEFFPVFSTFDQSYFFRVHKGAFDKQYQKQPFYIIITDRNINTLLELPFPENYYIVPIISKEGIMFMAFNEHDDKLELIRYRIS